jgi:F0F1-type ATP synthase assembly protein I
MSQDSIMRPHHRTPVTPAADPVARTTKRAMHVVTMSSVGLEFGVSVVIAALFGRWLDAKLGTTPWLLIVFIVLGFAAGLRSLIRATHKLDRDKEGTHG